MTLAQLGILEPRIRKPMIFSSAGRFVPEAEMSGDSVKILIDAIAGKNGQAVWFQAFPDLMEQLVGIIWGATANMERHDALGLSRDGRPDPNPFSILFDLCDQFIQLQMTNG